MALTDYKVSIIDSKKGTRVIACVVDTSMRNYLLENSIYIISHKTNNKIRITGDKPLSVDLLPDYTLALQRCADDIVKRRTKDSLASTKQIARVKQLVDLLSKRRGSLIDHTLVEGIEKKSGGEVGRLISDLKKIAIADGLWDENLKQPITK